MPSLDRLAVSLATSEQARTRCKNLENHITQKSRLAGDFKWD